MRTVDPEKVKERQRQILEAALVCFKEKGFHGAAMSTICRQAKMSPGHLYHYFSSKEDIINAIIEADIVHQETAIDELLQEENTVDAILFRLPGIWESSTGLHGALAAEVHAEASRNPFIAQILSRQKEVLIARLSQTLKTGQERGSIREEIDADGISGLILGAIIGLRIIDQAGGGFDRNGITQAFSDMLERMLRP